MALFFLVTATINRLTSTSTIKDKRIDIVSCYVCLISVPDIREILLDWDVVDPWFELRVEKLLPLIPNMKHQGTTEEEMLEAKAGSHTSEVE